MAYRGRFAPSPTGALHFGSLIAAVASFADARAHGGVWLVRIEDLDRPREVPGAAEAILRTLRAFGLHWDGQPLRQSRRTSAYDAALERLTARGLTYPCACSRSEIARDARPGAAGPIYAGTCRNGLPPGRPPRSTRLRTPPGVVSLRDRIQGERSQDVAQDFGDCILRRGDGLHAYQLAVVVDDAWQGINHVVRGADLLDSTPCQYLLQQALGLPTPHYAHVPLALAAGGRKLSKSLAAAPVDPAAPWPALLRAWAWLGQAPAPAESRASLADFWEYARLAWRIERVPTVARACVDPNAWASIGD
ncbi:tRNA glutamyl-Q(34) synthetase GluQRS [uncultured Thiodictyon sp.]|uniref:tRNA glutamyl-Q(34) synthetase GluQRS n=1 Tax=uncultured Thiodictyon sp. TaxID=1846217 RepID=UPI0025FF615C|nr:tRNA glutamyl-Q(34) synthetase GluQRS [uncultured Thiodictyon sp.]